MSVMDLKRQYLIDNTGITSGTISDLEYEYYSDRSGLTPKSFYSIADHKRVFYEAQTGLSGKTITHLERAYWEMQGTPLGSIADMGSAFYTFDPYKLANLELALDASRINGIGVANPTDAIAVAQWNDISGKGRHVTQAVGTKQPLYRNVNTNLLPYAMSMTSDITKFVVAGGGATIALSTAYVSKSATSIESTVTTLGQPAGPFTDFFPVTPNTSYTVSAKCRVPVGNANQNMALRINWYNAGFGVISTSAATTVIALATGWTSSSNYEVSPVGAVYAKIGLWAGTPATVGDKYYCADFQIEAGSVATAFVAPVTLPNNLPTVQFDGVDDYINSIAFGPISQPITVYVVCYSPISTGNASIVDGSTSGFTDRIMSIGKAGAQYRTIGGGATLNSGLNAIVLSNEVVCSSVQGATSFTSVNGVKGAIGVIGAQSLGGTQLGAYADDPANGILNGSIAAVLVFSVAHSDATRNRIEKWLGTKYNIGVV